MQDYDFDQSQIVEVKSCKGDLEKQYTLELVEYLRENPKRTIHSFWESKLKPRVRAPSVLDLRGSENSIWTRNW